jgi:hypothetical protein
VKDQLLAVLPEPSPPSTDLAVRPPYGAFGKTSSNGFGGEVRAAITFLCFELSETSDVLAGLVAAVLGRYLDLADHCCGQALIVDQLLELGGVSLSSSGGLGDSRSNTSPGSTIESPRPQFITSARMAAFTLTWRALPLW